MDRIISQKRNIFKQHQHSASVELLYGIRWYDYGHTDDTLEPISHLSQCDIISYHKSKKISFSKNIDDAVDS